MADDWRRLVYDEERRQAAARVVAAARRRATTPAVCLIVFGSVGLMLSGHNLLLAWLEPDAPNRWAKEWIECRRPTPAGEKMLRYLREHEAEMRLDTPLSLAGTATGIGVGLLTMTGGLCLACCRGYWVAMFGSIAGLLPIGGCCCFPTLFGLWAIVVLADPAVQAAFATRKYF